MSGNRHEVHIEVGKKAGQRAIRPIALQRSNAIFAGQETHGLMNQNDRVFTKFLFFRRQTSAQLPGNRSGAERHKLRRLMSLMGMQAMAKGFNTRKKHSQYSIYHYPSRTLPITRLYPSFGPETLRMMRA
jgi:hypothetical protein